MGIGRLFVAFANLPPQPKGALDPANPFDATGEKLLRDLGPDDQERAELAG